MATAVRAAFEVALGDVDNLIAHHPKSTTGGRGRPSSDEGPLNRSCILLLYAAWEVYAEDSVRWAVSLLCDQASSAEQLPEQLRAFVTGTGVDPWELAGDGWRAAAVDAVDERVLGSDDGASFGINTAGPGQLDRLHREVLGTSLISRCRWKNKPNSAVRSNLAALVRLRGEIAHTGKAPPGALSLQIVRLRKGFVRRLVAVLDDEILRWVNQQRHLGSGD